MDLCNSKLPQFGKGESFTFPSYPELRHWLVRVLGLMKEMGKNFVWNRWVPNALTVQELLCWSLVPFDAFEKFDASPTCDLRVDSKSPPPSKERGSQQSSLSDKTRYHRCHDLCLPFDVRKTFLILGRVCALSTIDDTPSYLTCVLKIIRLTHFFR